MTTLTPTSLASQVLALETNFNLATAQDLAVTATSLLSDSSLGTEDSQLVEIASAALLQMIDRHNASASAVQTSFAKKMVQAFTTRLDQADQFAAVYVQKGLDKAAPYVDSFPARPNVQKFLGNPQVKKAREFASPYFSTVSNFVCTKPVTTGLAVAATYTAYRLIYAAGSYLFSGTGPRAITISNSNI